MVSSKTRAELEVLAKEIGLNAPFISENGGGIFFPEDWHWSLPAGTIFEKGFYKLPMGTPLDLLVKGLKEIRRELGLDLRGFSEMSPQEICDLTGLDTYRAKLASSREFDEPFVMFENDSEIVEAVKTSAGKRGFQISRGGRFYHIHGRNDKGKAVNNLTGLYKNSCGRVFTIALGDSPNDFSMLKEVDQPVLISSHQEFPGIEEDIPDVIITNKSGPEGWNSVVQDILSKKIAGGIS